MNINRKRICMVVASEMTVNVFLENKIKALSQKYEVSLVVNTQQPDFAAKNGLPVKVIPLAIERAIRPVADMRVLYHLFWLFHRSRFDLVYSVTPKAGLLAMLAGKLAGVQFRVHIFTGQVWAIRYGFSRVLLKAMDRLLAACATHLLVDSASQRRFIIDQGIARAEKLCVLANGSICGVDVGKFKPNLAARSDIRVRLNVSDDAVLLLFLGRLNRDKGVADLAMAFMRLSMERDDIHLLYVGLDEGRMCSEIKQCCVACADRLHFVDYTKTPERYMAAADVFCLPSYREGFGSVIIEAAACALPTIGSNIYGIIDAIESGKSGLLFEPGNIDELCACIRWMVEGATLRKQMGEYARQRALRNFSSDQVTQAWLDYYDELL